MAGSDAAGSDAVLGRTLSIGLLDRLRDAVAWKDSLPSIIAFVAIRSHAQVVNDVLDRWGLWVDLFVRRYFWERLLCSETSYTMGRYYNATISRHSAPAPTAHIPTATAQKQPEKSFGNSGAVQQSATQ